MKIREIKDKMANIAPDLIEEAANYKRKRVSGIRVIAIAACLAILVTSVPLALIMSRRDETEPPKTTESETTKPNDQNVIPPEPLKVVYCDTEEVSLEELRQGVFKDKEVKIKDFKKFGGRDYYWLNEYNTIEPSSDIPEKITVNLNGRVYTGVLDKVFYYRSNTTNETLKSYTKMAIYLIEGLDLIKNQYIHYQVETQTILSISSLVINSSPGDCTKEYIYKRACEDLKSLYGDSILEKYYISHCVQLLNYPDRQMFEVRLKRTIGEYKTDSEIRLIYNGKGELSSLGTTSLTTFNFVEHLLNEKTLKEAEKEAHTLMGNKLVSNKELVMHIDGYLCIRFKLITGYEENGMPIETSFYYRVE